MADGLGHVVRAGGFQVRVQPRVLQLDRRMGHEREVGCVEHALRVGLFSQEGREGLHDAEWKWRPVEPRGAVVGGRQRRGEGSSKGRAIHASHLHHEWIAGEGGVEIEAARQRHELRRVLLCEGPLGCRDWRDVCPR